MKTIKKWVLWMLILPFVLASCAKNEQNAQVEGQVKIDSAYIAANYDKQEYMIPMRDGVKLYTVVYSPKDTSQSYPIMISRTPYSCMPYGEGQYPKMLSPGEFFVREGFIFVYQDVRGRFMSEGEFVDMRPHISQKTDSTQIDESSDTYDTIEWLLKNLNNDNGRVGMHGISYPGFYTIAGAINSHEALKLVIPKCAIADWYFDDFHHHGAFFLPHYVMFYRSFGIARPQPVNQWPQALFEPDTNDGYAFFKEHTPLSKINEHLFKNQIAFWDSTIAHPDYDYFWQEKNILPHLENINAAVVVVAGWYDAEDLYGPFSIYKEVEKNNPNTHNMLVVGPWAHGGMSRGKGEKLGYVDFRSNEMPSAVYYQQKIELAAALHYLKSESAEIPLAEATMFNTGSNVWREFDVWPPKNAVAQQLYFSGGELDYMAPAAREIYSYISDPENPVPYTADTTVRMNSLYMIEDQRFLKDRKDVLSFSTQALNEDITIAGKVFADLFVELSASDADFVVKLIDVYPDDESLNTDTFAYAGFEQMVRSEVFRGRYRNSYEKPQAFTPGKIEKVQVPLQDVLHTFKKGHKIMIQVQSSWFPLVDLNPQKYVPNIFMVRESDFVKQEIKVHSSAEYPSGISFSVLATEI